MNILEIVKEFELGNVKNNKLVACLIKNNASYYKHGLRNEWIKLYGFDKSYLISTLVEIILHTDDVTVIDLIAKSFMNINFEELCKKNHIKIE